MSVSTVNRLPQFLEPWLPVETFEILDILTSKYCTETQPLLTAGKCIANVHCAAGCGFNSTNDIFDNNLDFFVLK